VAPKPLLFDDPFSPGPAFPLTTFASSAGGFPASFFTRIEILRFEGS
jgi:hypothetical protein